MKLRKVEKNNQNYYIKQSLLELFSK